MKIALSPTRGGLAQIRAPQQQQRSRVELPEIHYVRRGSEVVFWCLFGFVCCLFYILIRITVIITIITTITISMLTTILLPLLLFLLLLRQLFTIMIMIMITIIITTIITIRLRLVL